MNCAVGVIMEIQLEKLAGVSRATVTETAVLQIIVMLILANVIVSQDLQENIVLSVRHPDT